MGMRNRVAEVRTRRGLPVAALATAIGISRQAMYAIEAGTYVPNTAVSLRLARELGVAVEELFQLEAEPSAQRHMADAMLLEASTSIEPGDAVQLCYVGDRLFAAPAPPTAFWLTPSDGWATETSGSGTKARARVNCHADEGALHNRLLLSGCDPAMSLLAPYLQRAGVQLILLHQNSSQSLRALKRGEIHIAGTHLRHGSLREGASRGDANLSNILLSFRRSSIAVVSFAIWEEGLVTAPANPKSIRAVEDLARRNVRFINREAGAGCRALLDSRLAQLALKPADINGYVREVPGHLAAAAAVKSGSADCCIATQAAARVFGLGFVPLESARYDLVLRQEHLSLPAVERLLDTISLLQFRQELAGASGYGTQVTGNRLV